MVNDQDFRKGQNPNYPYPWLEDPVETSPCPVAGMADLAAMKLSAIAARGSRKDFVDFVCHLPPSINLIIDIRSAIDYYASSSVGLRVLEVA